ncbi:hypothetical protein WT71_16305 [Burkholderia stagnalis]|nr:hypothetical protein WT71_16305 [Burkholderia stagnalis]KWI71011.1 hypothetical protein WT73_14090 [Burkholderia stagnalis]
MGDGDPHPLSTAGQSSAQTTVLIFMLFRLLRPLCIQRFHFLRRSVTLCYRLLLRRQRRIRNRLHLQSVLLVIASARRLLLSQPTGSNGFHEPSTQTCSNCRGDQVRHDDSQ